MGRCPIPRKGRRIVKCDTPLILKEFYKNYFIKFLRVLRELFSKSSLSGVWGEAPL